MTNTHILFILEAPTRRCGRDMVHILFSFGLKFQGLLKDIPGHKSNFPRQSTQKRTITLFLEFFYVTLDAQVYFRDTCQIYSSWNHFLVLPQLGNNIFLGFMFGPRFLGRSFLAWEFFFFGGGGWFLSPFDHHPHARLKTWVPHGNDIQMLPQDHCETTVLGMIS